MASLFISGTWHTVFSEYSWLWITEPKESEIVEKGELLSRRLVKRNKGSEAVSP
jgi:hypothetical protein